jgi:hypothetical protein
MVDGPVNAAQDWQNPKTIFEDQKTTQYQQVMSHKQEK